MTNNREYDYFDNVLKYEYDYFAFWINVLDLILYIYVDTVVEVHLLRYIT